MGLVHQSLRTCRTCKKKRVQIPHQTAERSETFSFILRTVQLLTIVSYRIRRHFLCSIFISGTPHTPHTHPNTTYLLELMLTALLPGFIQKNSVTPDHWRHDLGFCRNRSCYNINNNHLSDVWPFCPHLPEFVIFLPSFTSGLAFNPRTCSVSRAARDTCSRTFPPFLRFNFWG